MSTAQHPAPATQAASAEGVPNIDGLWEIPTRSAKGESAWHFIVRQRGAEVSAAILRVDGDTGALTGAWRDGKLVLSYFSGARPTLLEITPAADGTLAIVQNGRTSLVALRPASRRSTRTNPVSNSGTASSVTTSTEVQGNDPWSRNTGTRDTPARTAPMKRLPQSPMNRRAGGRFQ